MKVCFYLSTSQNALNNAHLPKEPVPFNDPESGSPVKGIHTVTDPDKLTVSFLFSVRQINIQLEQLTVEHTPTIIFVFVSIYDLRTSGYVDVLFKKVKICREKSPKSPIVFVLSREAHTADITNITNFMSIVSYSYYFFGAFSEISSLRLIKQLDEVIVNTDNLLQVDFLMNMGSRESDYNIPFFGSHPNFPGAAITPAKPYGGTRCDTYCTAINISDLLRAKFVEHLGKELEEHVFDSSFGNANIYLDNATNQFVRESQKKKPVLTTNEKALSPTQLGKRRREFDLPMTKRLPITVEWDICIIDEYSKLFGYGPVSVHKLHELVGKRCEEYHRLGNNNTFNVVTDGVSLQVNVSQRAINGIPGTLRRHAIFLGEELNAPKYWFSQNSAIFRVKLEDSSPVYRTLVREFNESIHPKFAGRFSIIEIIQCQNAYDLRRYNNTCQHINAINRVKTSRTKRLYFGSGSISPDTIMESAEGIDLNILTVDQDQNWGKAIHTSEDPCYALLNCYRPKSEAGNEENVFEILVVHVMLGNSRVNLPDPNLRKCPLAEQVNNMPVFYNSLKGNYYYDERDPAARSKIWAVYDPGQVSVRFKIRCAAVSR
jgi:hypothetical protein